MKNMEKRLFQFVWVASIIAILLVGFQMVGELANVHQTVYSSAPMAPAELQRLKGQILVKRLLLVGAGLVVNLYAANKLLALRARRVR